MDEQDGNSIAMTLEVNGRLHVEVTLSESPVRVAGPSARLHRREGHGSLRPAIAMGEPMVGHKEDRGRFRDADGIRYANVRELSVGAEFVDRRGADPERAGGFSNCEEVRLQRNLRAPGL